MFSTIGILAISYLDSRCGLIGNVVVESIVGIGAAPRVSGAPLIRILVVVAREWRRLSGFDASAFAAEWLRLAHRALLTIASLRGIFSDSLGSVRPRLQNAAVVLCGVWSEISSEISIAGHRLADESMPGLETASCPASFGPMFGMRECYVR